MFADTTAWTADDLDGLFKKLAADWEVGFGKIAQPLRVAVSGGTISPSITETLAMLGKDSTMVRMGRVMELREGS